MRAMAIFSVHSHMPSVDCSPLLLHQYLPSKREIATAAFSLHMHVVQPQDAEINKRHSRESDDIERDSRWDMQRY
jgi:hypothetical protein